MLSLSLANTLVISKWDPRKEITASRYTRDVHLHYKQSYSPCESSPRVKDEPPTLRRSLLFISRGGTTRAKVQGWTHSCGVIRHEAIQTHQAINHRAQDEDRPTTSAHYFRFAGHAASSVKSISCFTCVRIYWLYIYVYIYISLRPPM